jgi:hypothetical protein
MFGVKKFTLYNKKTKGNCMDSIREFLVSPLGSIFAHFLKAIIGAVLVCAGIQIFDFRNLSRFFTLRKIIGLFLLVVGASRLIYVLFH